MKLRLKYETMTGRLLNAETGQDVSVSGVPGEREWREELAYQELPSGKTPTQPLGSKASSTEHHWRMRGGPWAGAYVAVNYKIWNGSKIARREPLEVPDIWFSSEFRGWYELVGNEWRWVRPLTSQR